MRGAIRSFGVSLVALVGAFAGCSSAPEEGAPPPDLTGWVKGESVTYGNCQLTAYTPAWVKTATGHTIRPRVLYKNLTANACATPINAPNPWGWGVCLYTSTALDNATPGLASYAPSGTQGCWGGACSSDNPTGACTSTTTGMGGAAGSTGWWVGNPITIPNTGNGGKYLWSGACFTANCYGNGGNGVRDFGFSTPSGYPSGRGCPIQLPTDPAQIPVALCDALEVATGGQHTCAKKTDGSVKCWGDNVWGQIGDGTTTTRLAPTLVSGVTARALAAGMYHSCALTTAGGVKCWGYNSQGQLGNGTFMPSTTPVDVTGLGSGVQQIVAKYNSTCALTSAGGVKCWGDNQNGQLGDGTTTNRGAPVDVSGLTSGVMRITGGDGNTCAVLTSGAVKCWGNNAEGSVGNGTTGGNVLAPAAVTGLTGSGTAWALDVASSGNTSCAISKVGTKCWGTDALGKIGNGGGADGIFSTPTAANLQSGVQLSLAQGHACSLVLNSDTGLRGVKCWGQNNAGQLGDGTTTTRFAPVDVTGMTGVTSGVVGLSTGHFGHTCAVTDAGGVKCWGNNNSGQLGNGTSTTSPNPTPVAVVGL
jgi:alpha-tubulin suppressor-like RCC1 family protein